MLSTRPIFVLHHLRFKPPRAEENNRPKMGVAGTPWGPLSLLVFAVFEIPRTGFLVLESVFTFLGADLSVTSRVLTDFE